MLGLGGWLDGWLGEKLSYPFEQPDECVRGRERPQLKLHHRRTNSIKLLRISVIDDLFLRFRLSGLRDELLCIFLHCGWLAGLSEIMTVRVMVGRQQLPAHYLDD